MNNEQLPSKPVTRGVYFLSNNVMLDLTIAFLNSFRTYNPTIPLCFIPYNDNVDQIELLKDIYHFDIFQQSSLLSACDQLSLRWHNHAQGEYRKLVAWEGRFDEFIYIDIDTVVLEDLSFCFEYLSEYGFITATSDIPFNRKFVWLDGVEECGVLDAGQIAYSANMGFFISQKGTIDFEYVMQRASSVGDLARYMEFICTDQPFLNYLIVTSGKLYTSLRALRNAGKSTHGLHEYWGGSTTAQIKGGEMYTTDGGKVFFIHWAGVWRLKDEMPNKEIWDYYRNMKVPDSKPGIVTV